MGQTWDGSTCNGTTRTYTWGQANGLTGTVTFAGQSDWRVPNIRELSTILDLSLYQPAIDNQIFPSTLSSHYWSSSPGVNYANAAYVVDFTDGIKNNYSQNYSFGVRLVRGGGSNILTIARPVSDYVDHGDGTVTHSPTGLTWMRCLIGNYGHVNSLA
jgi:hypothetical protein